MPDNEADDAEGPGEPTIDHASTAAEAELLDVFSRLAPVGSHRWHFEESMGRLNPQPPPALVNVVPPWEGLPPDVWARGRSAQVGQRMVGDVLAAVADLLATDARASAIEAAGAQAQAYRQQFTSAWDALRYLAARLERLERRGDVVADLFPDLARDVPEAEVGPWADHLADWFTPPDAEGSVIHGETGDGSLLRALRAVGYQVSGIEPRAERVWAGAGDPAVALGEVTDRLADVADGALAGVILSGCIDRLDTPGKLLLTELALSKAAPGATVAVLPTDQQAFADACPVTVSDLAPGRPFHPETWSAVLARLGLADVRWHRPEGGGITHAVVGRRR